MGLIHRYRSSEDLLITKAARNNSIIGPAGCNYGDDDSDVQNATRHALLKLAASFSTNPNLLLALEDIPVCFKRAEYPPSHAST